MYINLRYCKKHALKRNFTKMKGIFVINLHAIYCEHFLKADRLSLSHWIITFVFLLFYHFTHTLNPRKRPKNRIEPVIIVQK